MWFGNIIFFFFLKRSLTFLHLSQIFIVLFESDLEKKLNTFVCSWSEGAEF